ncbi:hypothetical protein EVAR_43444_1 [Eumeta japonica]|uniref:Uncharacterized protein n=1 Tax=Eumeta variegata TaxID=151549 RepID=A0A4C1Y9U7_EUMVA|nr:hypothetical protein EVAR_43444_1 [Eumeta japonica]
MPNCHLVCEEITKIAIGGEPAAQNRARTVRRCNRVSLGRTPCPMCAYSSPTYRSFSERTFSARTENFGGFAGVSSKALNVGSGRQYEDVDLPYGCSVVSGFREHFY